VRKKTTLTIYVEGGGDNRALPLECQRAFRLFFERAGLPKGSFTVYASGSRKAAYEDYCYARQNGENALLLVDSEEAVPLYRGTEVPISPWQHLAKRAGDQWSQPDGASPNEVHLMVPVMEAWFMADSTALATYYEGKFRRESFNASALPKRPNVDQLTKTEIATALANATRQNASKGLYHKGRHSFELLASLDPVAVARSSYHARRLLCHLKNVLQAAMTWLDCTEFATVVYTRFE
jgi:hypothetical protein